MEIRTPALIRSGDLLAEDRVVVTFEATDDWQGVTSIPEAIEREWRNFSADARLEALRVGEEVVTATRRLFE